MRKDDYTQWVQRYDTLGSVDAAAAARHIRMLGQKPLFSVIMPVYNVDARWLRCAIESVRQQFYPGWELCIADDHSSDPRVARVLREYEQADGRIKVTFRQQNGHVSAASNTALGIASGEYVALLDHDDELAPDALLMMAAAINAYPESGLLYSDEDKLDARGGRVDPYFKPDWNQDLFYAQNMISHLGVYRRRLVEQVGGFRIGFEGSQDYDLAARVIELLKPEQIRHIPHVLYHWRCIPGSTSISVDAKHYAREAARKAIAEHLVRAHQNAEVTPGRVSGYQRVRFGLPDPRPAVSLIIPTRDGVGLLRQCIDSIVSKTVYPAYDIAIVDNESSEQATKDYFCQLSDDPRIRVIPYAQPFNFSAINNAAAVQTRGEVLAFVNNDIEVIEPTWLDEMVSHALRPDIGTVGALLYYPDDTIQHAGVVLGVSGIAGHVHRGLRRGQVGYLSRAALHQNFLAVTAACLVVRRSVFEEVGGFDEGLAVAFNDVDLCLRIRAKGYRNLWTPYAELYHYESASRGDDMAPEKRDRFMRESALMEQRWGYLLRADPAYNPNLSLESEDFALAFPPRVQKAWRASVCG